MALESLFEEVLSSPRLNIGLARHVLRRAKSLGINALLKPLLAHVETFGPVIRDVGLYLKKVSKDSTISHNESHYSSLLETYPRCLEHSLLHYWLSWLFSRRASFSEINGVNEYMASSRFCFQAAFAHVGGQSSWVRDNKNDWQRRSTWDRWALLQSAELLSATERRIWMDVVLSSSEANKTDKILAKYVRQL